jgi:hypothetical protein
VRSERSQLAAIEAKFDGWEAWTSLDGQWHARIKNAVPPVMIHAQTAGQLDDRITAHIAGGASGDPPG